MAGGTRGASTSSDHWRQLHSPPSFKVGICDGGGGGGDYGWGSGYGEGVDDE